MLESTLDVVSEPATIANVPSAITSERGGVGSAPSSLF